MPAPDQYAVFGNPIAHSKSPAIHALFAEQTGQRMQYRAILAPIDGFEQAVREFAVAGGKGINITVPFKQAAFALASRLSPRAERAGAVNTFVIHDSDEYFGDNTDGIGLARDLIRNHGLTLSGKRILLLGAGGAVRGALEALFGNRPQQLTIANRTVEKAIQLADDFTDLGNINGLGFDDLAAMQFDLIINGTSASLKGEMPPVPASVIHADTFCYDMMYAAKPTVFMQWAADNGATTANISDGLGMLVEQAAESFKLWRGVEPQTQPVIEAIRASLI